MFSEGFVAGGELDVGTGGVGPAGEDRDRLIPEGKRARMQLGKQPPPALRVGHQRRQHSLVPLGEAPARLQVGTKLPFEF